MTTQNSNVAEIVAAIIEKAGSKFVAVDFIKVSDGTKRTINFNPKEGVKLVTREKSKATATRKANNPTLINVVDAAIANRSEDRRNGWRSFYAESVVGIRINGVEVYVA